MLIDPGTIGSVTDALTGQHWSGRQMRLEVERRHALLAHRGLGSRDVVLLAHANSLDFLADLLAVWRLGACAACLDPAVSTRERASVIHTLRPAATLVATGSGAAMGLCLRDALDDGPPGPRPAQPPAWPSLLDRPALVLFTSGTTASPRGVVHSYRALRARLSLNVTHIGRASLRRSLCVLPTHFGHGLIGNCLTALHAGADLVLCAGSGLQVGARLGSLVDEHDISFFSSVPALWRMVLRLSASPARARLSRIHVGSAPLTGDLWRDVQAWCGTRAVVNAYGLTEAANWVAGASGEDYAPQDGLVGRPWGGSAAVLRDDGDVRSTGSGELLLRVPSLMQGYFAQPEASAATRHRGWYRTGDLGDIAADGSIRLGARLGLVINRAGIKVHPEEIEAVLDLHPRLRGACAFAIPDPVGGEIVGCAVALVPDATIQPPELTRWCMQRLRPNAVPARWWILAELPRDARGKIRRREIARHCMQASDAE